MNLATGYILGASRTYPIMQMDMKENVQNCTNGKVYVKLAPGGQLGAGSALASKSAGGYHPGCAAFSYPILRHLRRRLM